MRALALLIALTLGGCAHAPAPITDFSQCVSRELRGQVQSAIADTEMAMAAGSQGMLLDLAGRLGFTVVDCAVQEILQALRTRLAASPHDELSIKSESTGRAWLTRGTQR